MKLPQIVPLLLTGLVAGCAGTTGKPPTVSAPFQPEAQATPTPPAPSHDATQAATNYVATLKKPLNLTEDQAKQLTEIVRKTHERLDALAAQRRVLNRQSVEIKKRQLEEMKALFTPEQMKKYEEMLKPPREVMEEAAPFPQH